MTGVQLIGKDAVISKFGKFDTDSWALYQGKQFIVGGVGVDELTDWLAGFEAAGSTATYTIKIFDSDTAPTASTANSDYMACMTFKLVDTYEGYGIAGHTTKLMDRIAGLEKKVKEYEEGDSGDSTDLNDIIMGWFSDPQKLGQVAGAIRQLMGGPGAPPAIPVQTVSGVRGEGQVVSYQDKEEDLKRVAVALDDLEKKDPNLIVHLEKLAKLAKNDPLIFQGVLSKLDAL
jgi:hypothetical protein